MKKLGILVGLLMSFSAFAQQSATSTSGPSTSTSRYQEGLYLGFDYTNFSDYQARTEVKSDGYSYENSSAGGMSMGAAGLTIGFTKTPDRGFGFAMGLRALQSINLNETSQERVSIFIPEVNMVYAMGRFFTGYLGANYSVMSGKYVDSYRGSIGGQAGVGIRFSRSITWNLGHTTIVQRLDDKDEWIKSSSEFVMNGFTSNLMYIF